jgi:hypothetical protein
MLPSSMTISGAPAVASRGRASIQDRDGGTLLLTTLFGQFPFLKKLFADSAYQGSIFANAPARNLPHLETEIVRRLRAPADCLISKPKS